MERWASRGVTFSSVQYLQTAYLVESSRLKPWVRNGNRLTAYLHTCEETMLRLCGLPEGNLEFAGFIADCPFNPTHISQVAVAPLVERPHQPYTGLDGYNPSGPCNLFRAHPRLLNVPFPCWGNPMLDVVPAFLNPGAVQKLLDQISVLL